MSKQEIHELIKAQKGTPQYEAWLEKYRAKKGKKQDSLFGDDDPGKGKVAAKDLKKRPPKFVKDKEIWAKAVDKITDGGKKPGTYGACVMLYKRKMEKKQKEQEAHDKLPAQLREDEVSWEKAISEVCSIWQQRLKKTRLGNHIEKAQKGSPQYEEWLRKYHEKRKKNVEDAENARKEAEAKQKAEAKASFECTMIKRQLREMVGANRLNVNGEIFGKEEFDSEDFPQKIQEKFGGKVSIYDQDKLDNAGISHPVLKDFVRMESYFSSNTNKSGDSLASAIKDKNKAIARFVAGAKISGQELSKEAILRDPFASRAIALGATVEDLKASLDSSPEVPEQLKGYADLARRHRYTDRFFGNIARSLDKEGVDFEVIKSGNAVTQEGRAAMARNGAKWTIGYTLELKKEDGTTKRYAFDAVTDEGNGPTRYLTGYGRPVSQAELVKEIKREIQN